MSIEDRELRYIRLGSQRETLDEQSAVEYLNGILPEVAPSLEERIDWLTKELLRAMQQHHEACHLAWKLFLAGTGRTEQTYAGIRVDPVTDVQQAVVGIAAGVLTPVVEKRNVRDGNDHTPTED